MFSSLLLNREITQAASLFSMISGIFAAMYCDFPMLGVAFIGISIWIMVISESFLLSKVQLEMQSALEDLNRRKEKEVEQVLYFLRQSSIAASPFESIDGAKRLCQRIGLPAMVLSGNYQIIKANESMHNILGWKLGDLNGAPAYSINDPVVMSKIGEYAAGGTQIDENTITSNYVYTTKNGDKVRGLMNAQKVGIEGYFITFYPEEQFVFSRDDVAQMMVQDA
jgi:hypothetical protein